MVRHRVCDDSVSDDQCCGAAAARRSAERDRQQLASKIEELDQQLRVLQRKLEIEKEQAAEKAKVTPTVAAGTEGYALKSADGDFQVKFRGYMQADGRFVGDGDTHERPDQLRASPRASGARGDGIQDLRLQADARLRPGARPCCRTRTRTLQFVPWLKVRAGKYKAPFGLERLQSATELTFVERGAPTNIAPNRDLGAMALRRPRRRARVVHQVGVFNGVVDGGSADTDDHSGKDFAGRVFSLPFKTSKSDTLKQLGVGVAATSGSQRGTLTAPNLPTYKTAGAADVVPLSRRTARRRARSLADGRHWRVGPQAYYYVGIGRVPHASTT